MSEYSESSLVAEAKALLPDDEEVLAAGIFGLADLWVAAAVGGSVGGTISGLASSMLPTGAIVDPIAMGAGAAAGQRLAATEAAAASGASLQLLVAITPTKVHVLNRDIARGLERELHTFDRAHVAVTVESSGLSRYLTLADPTTGDRVQLHGSTLFISPLAEGDKAVMSLLAEH